MLAVLVFVLYNKIAFRLSYGVIMAIEFLIHLKTIRSYPYLNEPVLVQSPRLSPPHAQRPLFCREAGEKEKDPPRAFYFSIIAIFIGIPSGSLCKGKRSPRLYNNNKFLFKLSLAGSIPDSQ